MGDIPRATCVNVCASRPFILPGRLLALYNYAPWCAMDSTIVCARYRVWMYVQERSPGIPRSTGRGGRASFAQLTSRRAVEWA